MSDNATPEPSLNEVLKQRGFTTKDAGHHRKYILRDLWTVFVGDADATWQWIGSDVSKEVESLSIEHFMILQHTLEETYFAGETQEMTELVDAGFMMLSGNVPESSDDYFELTTAGKDLAKVLARWER